MILNATTGKIYNTIAEAARASGVSASGISKASSGARQSAGGYSWERIATPAAAPPLVKAAAAAERKQKRESPGKYNRAKAARAKSRKRATQTRQAQKKAAAQKAKQAQTAGAAAAGKQKKKRASVETMIKRADTLEKIKQLNELRQRLIMRYETYHLESARKNLEKVDLLIKTIAGDSTAPGGYLRETKRFVADFSDASLERIQDDIRGTISEITVVSNKELQKLYAQYKQTIDKETLRKYKDEYSDFLELIGKARELAARTTGEGKYRDIYEAVVASAYRVTPQQLVEITKMIAEGIDQTDEQGQEMPITPEWVQSVLDSWNAELDQEGEEDEPPIFEANW